MTRGNLSQDFLDELRAKNDIVDVISKYITLTRRGGNFTACCPFHHEKTPSFSIKHDMQIFKCFGCGESGNVISFVMKIENVDFYSAVEILCKNAGMQMPNEAESKEMHQKKQERDRIYAILKATTEFYHKNLLHNPTSAQAEYLKKRGLSDAMIEKFQIGASLNYDDLPKHLLGLKFKPADMILAGVTGRGERDNLYDFYGTRLIFPIFNGLGETVAYSGRSVQENPDRTKYKNTTATPVFNKSEILFGFNFVREQKRSSSINTLIIVEGHIDVIACHQAGVENAVGCMGTALTTLHAKRIKQLVENVVLCLDGDNAGAAATYKAIDILKDNGLNVKVIRLAGAKDPDEFLKKFGKDQFLKNIDEAIDCVDFVLTDSAKKYDLTSNLEKNNYINEALKYISRFSTLSEQEIYLNVVQRLVKIPIDILRKTLNNDNKETVKVDEVVSSEIGNNKFIRESKIMLLAGILYKKIKNPDNISALFEEDDELNKIYTYLADKIAEKKDWTVSSLFDNFEISSDSLIDKVINYQFPDEDVFENFLSDTIKRVKLFQLQNKKDKYTTMMLSAKTDAEKYGYLNKIKQITDEINKEKHG